MSENPKSQNPEWFSYLSEEEQKTLAAGQITNMPGEGNFFFSKLILQPRQTIH
ncbi:hypothetical protein [Nostoc sp. PA-18-2419]|uniref:hypothetical protein n=1 Tax=Nostoc sp. PA-18-2419 TaxID=2575443 RepID=UPI001675B71A|nr:hypothetical protein [Nostoc sp. PA-18-2419]